MSRLLTIGLRAAAAVVASGLAISLATILPSVAQDTAPDAGPTADTDRGYLQALIEDNLSSDGTQVRIEGFVGSLASKSGFDRLTVADKDGIWLTLEEASLDWRRRALLTGSLDITELSVARIVLDRLPGSSAPKAEAVAAPFSLPELPVEIKLEAITAASITLGPDILGTGAELSLAGSARLSGGTGNVALSLDRIDGQRGTATVAASYSNTDGSLGVDVLLDEDRDGIAARLLGIYQQPALRLAIKGDGTLSDFTAEIDLSADAKQALTGQVTLTSDGGETTDANTNTANDSQQFSAQITGNLAALLDPRYAPFLGDQVALDVTGERLADTRIRLEQMHLETAAMLLDGQVHLGVGGMPEQFKLDGTITLAGQNSVILPLPGPDTTVASVTLTAEYDASIGDLWHLDALVNGLASAGLSIRSTQLTGSGTLSTGTEGTTKGVTATLRLAANGVDHNDTDLAAALGPAFVANTVLEWQQDEPIQISTLSFDGAGLNLAGSAIIDGPETGFLTSGQATLDIADMTQFSGLADREIAGAARVDLTGQTALRGGSFDVKLAAQTTDLATGEARLDPLLTGRGTVDLTAVRDGQGLRLSRLDVQTDHARISTQGALSSDSGQLNFNAALVELAQLDASLSGPATAEGRVSWAAGTPVELDQLKVIGAGVDLLASGSVDIENSNFPVAGTLRAEVEDLARLKGLAGMNLSGRLSAQAEGRATLNTGDFDVSLAATTQNIQVGITEADRLLAGQGNVTAKLGRLDGALIVEELNLSTPAARLAASSDGINAPIRFDARLADVGMIAPDFSGAATAQGTALPTEDNWEVSLTGTGPGGINADLGGTLATDFKTADLAIKGTAPLGLANPFIAPRSLRGGLTYDLRLVGAPGLENLSGRVTTSDARLSAPKLRVVLTNIDADVSLSNGAAQLDINSAVQGGGTIRLSGPLSLSAPFNAGLDARLSAVTVSDPALYLTRVDGELSVQGPLTGGGSLSGQLTLSETEIQVPSGQVGGGGYVPDITHISESADSRATRNRAGLLAAKNDTSTSGSAMGLDLRILAPGRIFVRGRGLDAEFGGDLRLLGDTNTMAPQGQFDLIRGRLDLLGKRFDLTQGLINIQGAFDPYISLIAETQNDAVTSRIIIEGPASDLNVSFTSDPELPEDEVVAQLLFGRDLTSLSAFQLAQLASAVATLTGRGGEGVVAKLRSGIGLDDLDVSSNDAGETQVRAGKYLSENLYSDIAVDAGGKTEVNLNLDINSSVKLKGRVTSEGNTGVGIYFQRDY